LPNATKRSLNWIKDFAARSRYCRARPSDCSTGNSPQRTGDTTGVPAVATLKQYCQSYQVLRGGTLLSPASCRVVRIVKPLAARQAVEQLLPNRLPSKSPPSTKPVNEQVVLIPKGEVEQLIKQIVMVRLRGQVAQLAITSWEKPASLCGCGSQSVCPALYWRRFLQPSNHASGGARAKSQTAGVKFRAQRAGISAIKFRLRW